VTFACEGNGAAIALCPAPVTIAGPGTNLSASGTVQSSDGLTATVSVQNIDIDLSPPTLSVTGVHSGSTYEGAAPKLGCLASDPLSGLATCVLATNTTAGATTYENLTHYSAIATNKAGATTEVSGSYTVDSRWFAGAKLSHGSWELKAGKAYELYCVTDGRRPTYLQSTGGLPTTGAGADRFDKVGVVGSSTEWELAVTFSAGGRASAQLNVGVKAGSRVDILSVRVTA
jgi:hypothetical protein